MAPPQPRNDFSTLFELLRSNQNQWMRVPLADLHGRTDALKRLSLRVSLTLRGLNVATRIENGYVFVRTLQSEKAVA